ncbi:MAG TPA: hypothetical protein PKH77_04835 [Anaerolineae bacterium]|nr:hypothetical protein [Anaerolineae bacterium]
MLRTTWQMSGRALSGRLWSYIRHTWPELLLWSGLLALILVGIRPPQVLVTWPAPQTVQTTNPKVGVHTRLTDEVEEWKIQRSLALVREMGAPWIVEYFPWPYIEYAPGKYDWYHSDRVVEHAHNQGLTLIARLGLVPAWARPDPAVQSTTPTHLDAAHYADFARFVAAFVGRYRGKVHHIIIWNEPNLSFEWGYRPVSPSDYVALLQAVYPLAHAANPEIVVLGGALAPTLEPEGSHAGLNDVLYLEKMYQAGAGAYFDALAAHTYGMNLPPDTPPAPDAINFRRVELLRAVMDAQGDSAKAIYITESGWNDHPRWVWAVSSAQRIQYTVDAYAWAAEYWPWCPVVAMWMFRTPQTMYNYQDHYAYVTPDFQKRLIYEAVQVYTGNTPPQMGSTN